MVRLEISDSDFETIINALCGMARECEDSAAKIRPECESSADALQQSALSYREVAARVDDAAEDVD